MTTARPRGQTMVLFSLSTLLLTVMVCLTLSIGMKTREKIELQTLADSIAFSNATATARVFNTIAVWNRAQISHLVVLAGAQSHIDYASWYLGALESTAIAATAAGVLCTAACAVPGGQCVCPACVNVGLLAKDFYSEFNSAQNRFKALDRAAGLEARVLQGQASLYGVAGKEIFRLHQTLFLGTGGMADDILKLAVLDATRRTEYKMSTTANTLVSAMELQRASAGSDPYPALPAVHGTRKSDFTRTRGGIIPPIRPPAMYLKNKGIGGVFKGSGAAYFGKRQGDANETEAPAAWAHDDGWQMGGLVWGPPSPCPWPILPSPANSHLKSTDIRDNSDEHQWYAGSPHSGSVSSVHTMGGCTPPDCPSVWVGRQEFNIDPRDATKAKSGATAGYADQWRQPKVYAALERDYGVRNANGQSPDPWNLMFKFKFTPTGTSGVDIGKKGGLGKFQKQLALATGITYYHRHMQDVSLAWQEPPNFFNPFWRATLVPADIDSTSTADLGLTLGAVDPSYTAAYLALKAAGFKGFQ